MADPGPRLRAEVADGEPVTVAEAQDQRERILKSAAFRQADVLRAIFSFVTSEAIKGNIAAVKEYTIGTEVLHLPVEFDKRSNNLVRVHANRLRQRLQTYYAGEGGQDAVIICVPKGSYLPRFAYRSGETAVSGKSKPKWRREWIFAAALILASFAVGLAVATVLHVSKPATAGAIKSRSNVYRFWKPFLASGTPPIIVLGQRNFLLNTSGAYLPYAGPRTAPNGTWVDNLDAISEFADRKLLDAAGRVQFTDAITGVGNAEAAVLLSRTFLELNAPAAVRKSRLLRVEDLHNSNVVFLGASPGNPLLDTVLENARHQGVEFGDTSGEKAERDPKTGALIRDVGRISVLPGLAEGRKAVVLTGSWTFGTLAAARFCTDERHLREILEYPGLATGGAFPEYLQAVVSGDLLQGELTRIRLVAARPITVTARPPSSPSSR